MPQSEHWSHGLPHAAGKSSIYMIIVLVHICTLSDPIRRRMPQRLCSPLSSKDGDAGADAPGTKDRRREQGIRRTQSTRTAPTNYVAQRTPEGRVNDRFTLMLASYATQTDSARHPPHAPPSQGQAKLKENPADTPTQHLFP